MQQPFPFAIVGFDLDGTLLDTHRDLAAAVNYALALARRPPLADAAVLPLIGGGVAQLLERALTLTGGSVDAATGEHLKQVLTTFYADHIAVHTRLYPGGMAMLNDLAERGVKLAVVTNKLEALAQRLLGELGLADRFFAVIGGDTLGPGHAKPAPDLLHAMLARAAERGTTGRAAFVGDTTFDIRAARAAGLSCVAVSFGFNDLPPDQLGADAVVDHFDALVGALERLWAPRGGIGERLPRAGSHATLGAKRW